MAIATVPGLRARQPAGQRECCRPKKAGDVEGSTHAATGLLLGAGVGLLTSAPHAHGIAVADDIARDLLFGALTAGFALLPDADHPQASFANAAGGLSHGISHLVAALFGGHRAGMHSFFGIGVMMLATVACTSWWPNDWSLGALALLLAICVKAGLNRTGFMRRGADSVLVSCALAAAGVVYARADLWWLVAMGMALHILEDEFSGHGCALLWPLTTRRFGGDGKQPAGRGSGRRTVQSPRARQAKTRRGAAASVIAPVPALPPRVRRAAGPVSMCLRCMVGECDACKGQGCKCPQPPSSHPARVTARRKALAEPQQLPSPEQDSPPF